MTTTSTQRLFIETGQPHVEGATKAFESGDLVLFPTDTLWSVGCDIKNPVALIRLFRLEFDHNAYPIELLVDSIDMLKNYVRHLHPRLETLLEYHMRPLSVIIEGPKRIPKELSVHSNKAVFRLVKDGFAHQLIQQLGRPIVSTFAYRKGFPLPTNLGAISSDILEEVDRVSNFKNYISTNDLPVMVELSDREELLFHRE